MLCLNCDTLSPSCGWAFLLMHTYIFCDSQVARECMSEMCACSYFHFFWYYSLPTLMDHTYSHSSLFACQNLSCSIWIVCTELTWCSMIQRNSLINCRHVDLITIFLCYPQTPLVNYHVKCFLTLLAVDDAILSIFSQTRYIMSKQLQVQKMSHLYKCTFDGIFICVYLLYV